MVQQPRDFEDECGAILEPTNAAANSSTSNFSEGIGPPHMLNAPGWWASLSWVTPVTLIGFGKPIIQSVRSRMCTPMSMHGPPLLCSFMMKPGRVGAAARRSIQLRAL